MTSGWRLGGLGAALVLAAAACGGGTNDSGSASGVAEGSATVTTAADRHPDAIPDFVFELHDGSIFQLAAEEKPVFLVFWAEWCPHCAQELPVLDRISLEYRDAVSFLAIGGLSTHQATIDRGAEWMPSGRIMWGVDDNRVIWGLFGARGTPTIALLTGDDRIVGAWAGEVGEAELRSRIDYLIAADSAAEVEEADLTGGEQSTVDDAP